MEKISDNVVNGKKIEFFKMGLSDFNLIKNFYSEQIDLLEEKKFFYPFKDSEIKSILSEDGGVFIGAFFCEELVGLSAIDFDKDYSLRLKKIIRKFYPIDDYIIHEYSGVVVKKEFRGMRIAKMLYNVLLDFVKDTKCYLCAVIHIENLKSLNNFFTLGFKMVSIYKLDDMFKFAYLVKGINVPPIKHFKMEFMASDFDDELELLNKGFVGVGVVETKEKVFIKFT